MLRESHIKIIAKLANNFMGYAGRPANLDPDDLIQSACARILEKCNEEDLLDGNRFTERGISVIGGAFGYDIYHTPNSSAALFRRPVQKEFLDEEYINEKRENLIEPSKILKDLTNIEKDIVGGRIQKYPYLTISKMTKIPVDKVEEMTKQLLSDPQIQQAFLIQSKRVHEEIPKIKPKRCKSRPYSRTGLRSIRLRRLGLCPNCGDDPATGKVFCQHCIDVRQHSRGRRGRNRAKENARSRISKKKAIKTRKRKGLCSQCGKQKPLDDKETCITCYTKKHKIYADRKEAGLCVICGKVEAREGLTSCDSCGGKASAYSKQYAKKLPKEVVNEYERKRRKRLSKYRKENNLCSRCGKVEKPPGRAKCDKCHEKTVEQRNARKQRRLSQGLCYRCGEHPHKEDNQLCVECFKQQKARYNKHVAKKKKEKQNGS